MIVNVNKITFGRSVESKDKGQTKSLELYYNNEN
jgi:hypothetical protein